MADEDYYTDKQAQALVNSAFDTLYETYTHLQRKETYDEESLSEACETLTFLYFIVAKDDIAVELLSSNKKRQYDVRFHPKHLVITVRLGSQTYTILINEHGFALENHSLN